MTVTYLITRENWGYWNYFIIACFISKPWSTDVGLLFRIEEQDSVPQGIRENLCCFSEWQHGWPASQVVFLVR